MEWMRAAEGWIIAPAGKLTRGRSTGSGCDGISPLRPAAPAPQPGQGQRGKRGARRIGSPSRESLRFPAAKTMRLPGESAVINELQRSVELARIVLARVAGLLV
jgi:hypothetical protein